jgi:4-hydroxy-4-methyl-2-oxoglutarate aldolase
VLEDPPLLTIRRPPPRPPVADLQALAELTTGWVVDAQDGRAALAPAVKPIFPGTGLDRCWGRALTCACAADDNLAIMAAVTLAEPGDVIVAALEGFKGSGVVGDILAGIMRNNGIRGLVTDGAVRDLAGLREAGLPVFAAAVNANSCSRNGPGTVGLPVAIAGRRVATGDLVIADGDGVATIPHEDAPRILARIAAIRAAEAEVLAAVRAGRTEPPGVAAILAGDRVRWID